MVCIVCAILFVIIIITYKYIITPHSHWKRKGIKYIKPIPLVGIMLDTILQKKSFLITIREIYMESKNERYLGVYQFLQPILIINDPTLMKKIAIKDFDSFIDRPGTISEDIDPLFAKNLFSSRGQKWQALRVTLSPAFTSSKMKMMFTLMNSCAEEFTKHFLKNTEDIITVEMKHIFTKYTNDVVATCAFGVNCDSLNNPDNDFYRNGAKTMDFSGLKGLKFFGITAFPTLMKLLRLRIISTSTGNFFREVIAETIKLRQEKKIIRPDMIHLLLQARKNLLLHEESQSIIENSTAATKEYNIGKSDIKNNLELTDEDITAQAITFFLAGFDTTSTLMIYFAYELAVNSDIQDKLRAEIDSAIKESETSLTYDILMQLKYLDMVISETLRKWPQGPMIDRLCMKDYEIPAERSNEAKLLIEKGTVVWYPISGIHRDPKYYPNPDKFDPERFNDQNKSKISPETFVPFGLGPRNCIASRFALLETKVIMFHILSKFEIVPVKKSQIPVVQSKKHFLLYPEGGMWLGLKKR